MNIKDYLKLGIVVLISFLGITLLLLIKKNNKLENELSISKNNEKVYLNDNSSLNNDITSLKFNAEQLKSINDSLIVKLNDARKKIDIKDKQLKSLHYIKLQAIKTDTIVYKDTLFKESVLNLDTIIGDNWYKIKLTLSYPNTVVSEPVFNSELYIMTYTKKETINPPKKIWLFRIFQKKQKVLHINVINENPYVELNQQRFVEIIK